MRSPESIDGRSDELVSEYLRSEVLERLSEVEIAFLTRTSILERLSGPLCEAVVGERGSTDALQRLAQSTLLIDDYGGTYRYHTLLREFLRRELAVREPQRVTTLHRRAAAWYQANHALEPAVDHAFAAGDLDLAATLVGNGFGLYHWSGRRATIRAWAMRFGAAALAARPWLAVLAAWEEMAAGDVGGDGALRGHRRAWNVRGQAARRHSLLRGRPGDAPGRHGPPGRRGCARECNLGG